MPRPHRHFLCPLSTSLAALATMVGARPARADEPVRLEYSPIAGCPDESTFFAAVARRSRVVRRARDGETATVVTLSIARDELGFQGRVDAPNERGPRIGRQVTTATCDEAIEALAFVTVLALDPTASPSVTTAAPSSSPPPVSAQVGLGGAARGALAPRIAFGASVFAEVFPFTPRGPSLRLGGTWAATGEIARSPGAARFRLLGGAIDACPVAFFPTERLRLAPCIGVEIGSLRAAGAGVDHPATVDALWSAAALTARAQWQSRRWFVEVDAGAALPFRATNYFFDPPFTRVYATGAVGGVGEIAVGVRFP